MIEMKNRDLSKKIFGSKRTNVSPVQVVVGFLLLNLVRSCCIDAYVMVKVNCLKLQFVLSKCTVLYRPSFPRLSLLNLPFLSQKIKIGAMPMAMTINMTLANSDKPEDFDPTPDSETMDSQPQPTRFTRAFVLKVFTAIFLTLWLGSGIRREDKI